MTRHIIDHRKGARNGSVLRRFADVERQNGAVGPHPTTASLQRRPQDRVERGSARVRAYMKIDRSTRD
ncbi:hypothetical protein [Aliiroseovarius sp. YM-037]|uniref:hypothetical protein n=1 Tax=Aliiroseovarius sp. YM-037 TaxID=3341728 RepID=UPI003A811AA3